MKSSFLSSLFIIQIRRMKVVDALVQLEYLDKKVATFIKDVSINKIIINFIPFVHFSFLEYLYSPNQ